MKDYLNSQEKEQVITFIKAIDYASLIETEWNKRGNLTKDELRALRNVITWSKKFAGSLLERQNETSKKAIYKSLRSSHLILDYKSLLVELLKKRNNDITAGYEENKDYFSLVELIMYYNCMNCTRACSTCDIYKEFEIQNIPELNEEVDHGNCKYSYTML